MIDNKYVHLTLEIAGKSISIGKDKVYGLIGLEGTESSTYDISTNDNVQYDGETVISERVLGRVITIDAVQGKLEAVQQHREKLIHFFRPKEKGMLTIDYMGIKRKIDFYLRSFLCPRTNICTPLRFTAILYCPNPYFMDVNEFRGNIAGKIPLVTSYFAIPLNGVFAMSAKMFQTAVSLNNSGDKETGLEIEMYARGPVENPAIENKTTGEKIRLLMSLKEKQRVIISTQKGNKKVVSGFGDDLINVNNKLDKNSIFFQLIQGENIIKFSTDDGMTNVDVFPRFNKEYLGV